MLRSRPRSAWAFFKEATDQPDADSITPESARRLLQAADNPGGLISHPKIALPPDFGFPRKQRQANRAGSVSALATAEHESDSLSTLEEYADGDRYEGRADLGDTDRGDGRRFKGRGYVQLTGRLNATDYAQITTSSCSSFRSS